MMGDIEQAVLALEIDGYTIVHDVLSASAIAQLRDFVLSETERIGVDTSFRGDARHLANLVTLDPMFFALIDHQKVLPIIESVIGADLVLGSLNARVVRGGDGEQSLHSDVPLPLHRYHPDAPVMINTIWPLHDFSNENGATRLVPGSHQSRRHEPPSGYEIRHEVVLDIPAGSVAIINGQTWHGGGANQTATPRAAMFGHYRYGQWLRFQCDPHDQFPEAWWQLLSARQKQLLRMTHGVGARHGADFYER